MITFSFEVFGAPFLIFPNAIIWAYAELLNVAACIMVVIFDQVSPRVLLRLLAGILEFSSPIRKPIADLQDEIKYIIWIDIIRE